MVSNNPDFLIASCVDTMECFRDRFVFCLRAYLRAFSLLWIAVLCNLNFRRKWSLFLCSTPLFLVHHSQMCVKFVIRKRTRSANVYVVLSLEIFRTKFTGMREFKQLFNSIYPRDVTISPQTSLAFFVYRDFRRGKAAVASHNGPFFSINCYPLIKTYNMIHSNVEEHREKKKRCFCPFFIYMKPKWYSGLRTCTCNSIIFLGNRKGIVRSFNKADFPFSLC